MRRSRQFTLKPSGQGIIAVRGAGRNTPPNPFYCRSRISAKKFRQLLRLFALDLTATDAAHLTGLTGKSVTVIFLKIRGRLAKECERQSPLSSGQVEVDESYFGARRVRGKRGRGASGKTIIFGLLKRDGKVYTEGWL